MDIHSLVARQCDFEGFRERPYQDSVKGIWTVGYGSTVWHGMQVSRYYPALVSKADALVSLKASLLDAMAIVTQLYPWYGLTQTQQEVLVHMAYQLGNKLNEFKRMNGYIEDGDEEGWVRELIDSKYYQQTPRPAKAFVNAIQADRWI